MTLVRILVDGDGLLDHWPELAPGKPRQSESAREELIHALTQYHDAEGVPITVVFDGTNGTEFGVGLDSTQDVEVKFTRPGQPVRQLLERLSVRLQAHGNILIATDNFAETGPGIDAGLTLKNCDDFRRAVQNALADLEREIEQLNLRENQHFSHHG